MLKSPTKNIEEVTVRSSSKVNDNSNDKTNFQHNLLLTDRQVTRLHKSFVNNPFTIIKLSKTKGF